MPQKIGAVVVGRNEAERLPLVLAALANDCPTLIYVDSDSVDRSRQIAAAFTPHTIEMKSESGLSVSRARNLGFAQLMADFPETEFVQFIDGDCIVQSGWIRSGVTFLAANLDAAAVCGFMREERPDQSVFNRLRDVAWDRTLGVIISPTGNFLVRAEVFAQMGGFNEVMTAGEEAELFERVSHAGFKVHRIDCEMVTHDARMLSWRQWWLRCRRDGMAILLGMIYYRYSARPAAIKQLARIIFWALLFPSVVVALAIVWDKRFLILFSFYGLQFARVFYKSKSQNKWSTKWSLIFAFFMVIDKWPQLWGLLNSLPLLYRKKFAPVIDYR